MSEARSPPPLRGRGQGEGGVGATLADLAPVRGQAAVQTSTRAEASAKRLRRTPTFTEKVLWRELRKLRTEAGLHFRRQAPLGPYVVDFVCHSAKLIVEVDGGVHHLRVDRDQMRDAWLTGRGYRVLRLQNAAALENVDATVALVISEVGARTPPGPSPQGGGA